MNILYKERYMGKRDDLFKGGGMEHGKWKRVEIPLLGMVLD